MARQNPLFATVNIHNRIPNQYDFIEVVDLTDDADEVAMSENDRQILRALEIDVDEGNGDDDVCILYTSPEILRQNLRQTEEIKNFKDLALNRLEKFSDSMLRSVRREVMRMKQTKPNVWTNLTRTSPSSCSFLEKTFLKSSVRGLDLKSLVKERMTNTDALMIWMIHKEFEELKQKNRWERNVGNCPIAFYVVQEIFEEVDQLLH